MSLSGYSKVSYRLFGRFVAPAARHDRALGAALERAHSNLRPDVYLSISYLNIAIATAVALLFALGLAAAARGALLPIPYTFVAAAFVVPFLVVAVGYGIVRLAPRAKASLRARDIDAKLPYALNYISTMSGAGFTPERIFYTLAAQPVYGEVAAEAAWITRDLQVLGKDFVTALTDGIKRSPSAKWQDILQGAITTFTSGGHLKDYFVAKSEQFLVENRQNQKKFIEGLAIIAESYVTVIVAAPLFLIVLLSVMLMFGGSGGATLESGYLLVVLMIPLAQFGFAVTINLITPEV